MRALDHELIVIDEIQRQPGLFEILRGVIDEHRSNPSAARRFLLLGSASLDLLKQASETLAGRISYVEMGPVSAQGWNDRDDGETRALWLRGGFPNSLLAANDEDSLRRRRDFIRSYLERDVPMFAPRMPAETLVRLWTMLAHQQGAIVNQHRLATSLAVSGPTIARYVDLLCDLLLVRRLRPWSGNTGKRLIRSPRLFIRDSGLVHALLEFQSLHDVLGHPVAGHSFEGFAIENLISAAGDARVATFFRGESGAEADLVLERGGRVEYVIEIKNSTSPQVSRGFHAACEVLKPKGRYFVHAGSENWSMSHGVTAVSLRAMMDELAV